jgi:hypothetical protein
MLYVSIFIELLRSRPALAVWLAALMQGALWTLIPTVFYAGPPGDVPFVLAVGNEMQLGSYLGPPLAFWLAEAAFVVTGNHLFGVYLLSQLCVVVTYWSVFALGRAIVGAQQAALAVLLMVGVFSFTVPTPEFGPVILSMPLWSLVLLHYWLAVNGGRRVYWVALAVEIGLLLLTTYAGLLLLALLAVFTAMNHQARAAMRSTDPWLASPVAIVVLFPHLLWLIETGGGWMARLLAMPAPELRLGSLGSWFQQIALILVMHAGMAVLVLAVIGRPRAIREPAPVIGREPVTPFSRQFVLTFAIAPALAGTVASLLAAWPAPVGGIAPLVLMSGLAVVMLAGDGIEISHQYLVISVWFGLLLMPPVLAIVAVLLAPWLGYDLSVNKPVRDMGRFFSDSFQRRTGKTLSIVAGDPRSAALVSLGARSRPSLFLDATPERTPWITAADLSRTGAVVLWPASDTAGTPPPAIKQRFPDLLPDVPKLFDRPIAGRLPALRYGWAVIRPKGDDANGQTRQEGKK